MQPSSGVGNGPGHIVHRWVGDDAVFLAKRIELSPIAYPWRDHYRIFPGPNSNTYAQWVLGPLYALSWRGVGARYASPRRLAKAFADHSIEAKDPSRSPTYPDPPEPQMNAESRKSLISKNAMIWVVGILASFLLPMIAKGMTDGSGNFLQVLTHVGPLFLSLFLSTLLLSKATAPTAK